jgi:hypothetical protein
MADSFLGGRVLHLIAASLHGCDMRRLSGYFGDRNRAVLACGENFPNIVRVPPDSRGMHIVVVFLRIIFHLFIRDDH